jgi:hypothetical protein
MKRLIYSILFLLIVFALNGCDAGLEPSQGIELLYSASYENRHDFDSPIMLIDTYEDYLESGYPIDLTESFFEDYVLYTYAFLHHAMGSDIFLLNGFEVSEMNDLIIYYEINEDVIVLDAFGMYAMIFSISKPLYESVDEVTIESVEAMDESIRLLYSGSYENVHLFDEPITWITSYEEYLKTDYPFELSEQFFDTYNLFTYDFLYTNLGHNIFLMDDYLTIDSNLILHISIDTSLNVSPAYGEYALIFAIPKELQNNFSDVKVVFKDYDQEMYFNQGKDVRSIGKVIPLYFSVTEDSEFGIHFTNDTSWPITRLSGTLYNLTLGEVIPMSMFSGLYGYHASLEAGDYVLLLTIDTGETNAIYYPFSYEASLLSDN